MRNDVIKGFYGDKRTGYRGITGKACVKFITKFENLMLKWLLKHGNFNGTSLK